MNMDVSSLEQFNNQRSIPEQAFSELNHEVKSKGISNEKVLQFKNAEKHKNTEDSNESPNHEALGSSPEDPTVISSMELPAEGLTRNISSPKKGISEIDHESVFESGNSEVLQRQAIGIENVQNGSGENRLAEQAGLSLEEAKRESCLEQMRTAPKDLTTETILEQLELPSQDAATDLNRQEMGSPPDDELKCPCLEQFEAKQEDEVKNPRQQGHRKKGQLKEKIMLSGSTRVLRSRSQEKSKTPEPVNAPAQDAGSKEKKRKKKKKKQMKKIPNNEFSTIRTHLRYLLTRMNYEQNLIDAYSGEGWKGQSLEKIKPEKELQRAKTEIFRRKLKIRDLFDRIEKSCAEGRFPESLFDSEGQIDSEDIFCAKCGHKDVRLDNDIILCDGACERGFHQFCLEPPLLKEQVPPGDEGWLCPACDCKVDCIDLLNDSQGTNLSINDSWEKVFPEAAVAGNKLDDNLGLSSDDSEDDDYNPDGRESDENVEGEDSSSDESDSFSASENLGAVTNNEQHLGLPSDDSEDDDYNPDIVGLDEQVKQESSSSDFTSDSEDISVVLKDEGALAEVQVPSISEKIEGNGEKSKIGVAKRHSIDAELLTLLESDLGVDGSAPISGKRHVERLDYKKLHDETYGCNVSSDSSDEEFIDSAAPKRRKSNIGRAASVPSTRKTPVIKHGTDADDMDIRNNQTQNKLTPKKKRGRKLDYDGTSSTQANSHNESSELGSSDRGTTTKSAHRRLGEAVTQRLYESFKENQYPERGVKENLAKELKITVHQISKWFENARWSFRHSDKGTQVAKSLPGTSVAAENATSNGVETKELSEASAKRYKESSTTPKSRKKKVKADHDMDINSSVKETPKQNAPADSPKGQGVRRSGRIQSKSDRKSVS